MQKLGAQQDQGRFSGMCWVPSPQTLAPPKPRKAGDISSDQRSHGLAHDPPAKGQTRAKDKHQWPCTGASPSPWHLGNFTGTHDCDLHLG
jgi:hypothetical protein